MALSPDQIAELRTSLRKEQLRILGNIAALQEEFGATLTEETEENGLETHIADQGTMTFLRERDLSLEEHEQGLIEEIEAAFERIEDGTYGVCQVSGKDIPFDRMQALPWAKFCLEHAPA